MYGLIMAMENIKSTVIDKLKSSTGKLRHISSETNIPYPTLLKIGQGVIKNPGIDHMQTLYDYFKK